MKQRKRASKGWSEGKGSVAPQRAERQPAATEQIGLIVRGQQAPDDRPFSFMTHADAMLSTGEPVGYYGDESQGYGTAGMGMDGTVYRYDDLLQQDKRRGYVDGQTAREQSSPSTLCTLPVTPQQAEDFDGWWEDMEQSTQEGDTESFSIMGDNCAGHAAEAFAAAGLIRSGELPGFDTPLGLEDLLRAEHGDALKCESGFLDFQPGQDGGFEHRMAPPLGNDEP
jgi:hypothetical protein